MALQLEDGRSPQAAVLEAQGISKDFGRVHALSDVSFALRPGEVHALAGQNGAGKSTLIKILTGYHAPSAGRLFVSGRQVHFSGPRDAQVAGISTMYQEVNLVPLRSVAHNLFLGSEPRTRWGLVDQRKLFRDARDLLDRYGMGAINARVDLGSLPLGIQQMVALVRAAAANARVLVMDEPTSALNDAEVRTLFSVVRRLVQEGAAVIYVSHRLDELFDLCHRVTVLRDGRVVGESAMSEITRQELVDTMLGRALAQMVKRPKPETTVEGAAPALSVTNLHGGPKVRDVSFTVRPGEVVALAGLLGSGRTETVETIFGVERSRGGEVHLGGRRLRPGKPADAIDAGLAFLPEDRRADGVIPNMSVRDNILLTTMGRMSRFGFVKRAAAERVVSELMDRLSVRASGPDQRAGELSGGNQQKVLLARWLAAHPKVLILDDPTRGIDVGAKAEVQSIVAELAADGAGIVMISSELEELLAASDRALVLRSGEVVTEIAGNSLNEQNIIKALAGDPAGTGSISATAAVTPRREHVTPRREHVEPLHDGPVQE
ncbi:MAG TPA: sugar ABC transporter ATP-binding protein [Acidimicrobiales bacterium]|nr:sugar ABC transporter ATP-binding protein [Acidimicrobiales bacterium]